MLAWQVPYLGWRHLPAELSEFEISRFFTFEPAVHRADGPDHSGSVLRE